MSPQFSRALQLKQMCHVQTFCHCPPVYVLRGICHDQMINQRIYKPGLGGMTLDSGSSKGTEERGIKDMERKPNVKEEQGGMDKE